MKSLAKISIRVFSIFLIIKGIQIIPSFLIYSTYEDTIKTSLSFYNVISISLMSACGILLWAFADVIANKIIGKDTDNISVNYTNIQIAAFSVVGLIILVNSLPSIAKNIFNILSTSNMTHDMYSAAMDKYKSDIAENVVKAILGFWLLIGSRGIVNLINRIRSNDINNMDTYTDLKLVEKTETENEDL